MRKGFEHLGGGGARASRGCAVVSRKRAIRAVRVNLMAVYFEIGSVCGVCEVAMGVWNERYEGGSFCIIDVGERKINTQDYAMEAGFLPRGCCPCL